MQSLNTLVQQSKVLYLGISDAPAWVVVKANAYARQHGLRPFSVYQGRFSAHARDLERDVIPMCRDEGMGLHPWGVMGSGFFRSPSKENEGSRKTSFILNGREEPVSQALDGVAQRLGTSINSVALAYVLHKAPYIFPTIGGRKVEHLKSNVEALSLHLSPEDIDEIENGYDFDLGFPHSFLSKHGKAPLGPEDINVLDNLGYFDYVKKTGAVQAHQGDLGDIWKA